MNSSLEKIFEDIESIKKDIKEIKEYLEIGVELREEVKKEIEEARERIKKFLVTNWTYLCPTL